MCIRGRIERRRLMGRHIKIGSRLGLFFEQHLLNGRATKNH